MSYYTELQRLVDHNFFVFCNTLVFCVRTYLERFLIHCSAMQYDLMTLSQTVLYLDILYLD